MFEIGQSTLEEMYLEITERTFPFLTLNFVDADGKVITSNTVPWARFREADDRPDVWEIRNSDELPTHVMYVAKKHLSRFILMYYIPSVHSVFNFTLGRNE